jgi:hypothetical protein
MRFRIAALALLLCGQVHAAFNCDTSSLENDEALSAYLLYYGKSCVDARAKAQLREWRIADSAPDLSKLIPAWYELAERFRALSARSSPSQLSQAYSALATRAAAAGESLRKNLEARRFTGEYAYANAAWKLPESIDVSDLYFAPHATAAAVFIQAPADQDCVDRRSELCRRALAAGKDLMLSWRLANDLSFRVSQTAINQIGDRVAEKKKLWDRYLYDSKPMQLFDFVATDFMDGRWKKSDQYPDGFREPPDTQWFLLHLSVAVEQLGAAPDGEEFKPVLVLEVFGANRWRADRRWFPVWGLKHLSGASLAVTYADRAGVRDTGVGPVLTFDNVYSVGLIRYESNTALLFSIDLSNLYREKNQEKYESFKRGVQNKLF